MSSVASDGMSTMGEEFGPANLASSYQISVRTCKYCACKSSDPNPIQNGPWASESTIAWLYGTGAAPEGFTCKPCWGTYTDAAFAEEYKSLQALQTKMKDKETGLTVRLEFLAARKEYIKQINEGNISLRCRGRKKEERPCIILISASGCGLGVGGWAGGRVGKKRKR